MQGLRGKLTAGRPPGIPPDLERGRVAGAHARVPETLTPPVAPPPLSRDSSDLTEVLQAIAEEDDRAEGRARYTQVTPDGVSLKDVALGNAGGRGHLSSALNPAYSVYTYALWRSPNGSGQDKSSQPREDMTFLDKPIDGYADAIVDDEFEKQSGYDKAFTAETIRATGMWMAAVTGLYDAADACRRRDENPPVDPGTFVSPVDAAAALWLGDAAAAGTQEGSSLYAWAARAGVGFTAPTYPDGVNQEIVAGLREMQALLDECLGLDGTAAPSEPATTAPRLYKTAEEVRGHMTVPLVQSLIRAAAEVGAGDTAADAVDRLIVSAPVSPVCVAVAGGDPAVAVSITAAWPFLRGAAPGLVLSASPASQVAISAGTTLPSEKRRRALPSLHARALISPPSLPSGPTRPRSFTAS